MRDRCAWFRSQVSSTTTPFERPRGAHVLLVNASLLALVFISQTSSTSALTPPIQSRVLRFGGDSLQSTGPINVGFNGRFTIEFWARPEKLTDSSQVVLFMDPSTGTWLGRIELPKSGKWIFQAGPGHVEATVQPALNRWTHVAARGATDRLEIFIDGILAGTRTIEGPVVVSSANLEIGLGYHGALRQMRFWKDALSNEEIVRFAGALPDRSDPRMLAWWPMGDGERDPLATDLIEDLGPNGLDISRRNPASRVRWVRPAVLESGPYFDAQPFGTQSPKPTLIDFDHDGDLDVYTVLGLTSPQGPPPYYTGEPPEPDRAYRNDGTGQLVDVSDAVLQGPRIQSYLPGGVHVADFTGDANADVFISEPGAEIGPSSSWGWPEGFRSGTSTGHLVNESAQRVEQRKSADHRSTIGDIDGDGDLDVGAAGSLDASRVGSEQRSVYFYVNDGTGHFSIDDSRTPSVLNGEFPATSVALIDTDLDGDLDLYWGEPGNFPYDRLLSNDGTGRFLLTPDAWQPLKHRFPGECTVWDHPCRQTNTIMEPADLNRDGLLDLAIGVLDITDQDVPPDRMIRPFLHILLGNGDGTLRDGSALMPDVWRYEYDGENNPSHLSSMEAIDQNGDGWLDIAVNEFRSVAATLLVNHGSAGFEEAGDLLPPNPLGLTSVEAGDLDRDTDTDLVWGETFLRNVKPYSPNAFPVADLSLDLELTRAGGLQQKGSCTNNGHESVHHITMAVPVPHGFTWTATAGGVANCSLDRHVVICTRTTLEAGEVWTVHVTSQPAREVDAASTFALASVTGDVLDSNLTNNFRRVRLDEAAEPSRRRSVRRH